MAITQHFCFVRPGSMKTSPSSSLNNAFSSVDVLAPFFQTPKGLKLTLSAIVKQCLAAAIVVSQGGRGECSKLSKAQGPAVADSEASTQHPTSMSTVLDAELADALSAALSAAASSYPSEDGDTEPTTLPAEIKVSTYGEAFCAFYEVSCANFQSLWH